MRGEVFPSHPSRPPSYGQWPLRRVYVRRVEPSHDLSSPEESDSFLEMSSTFSVLSRRLTPLSGLDVVGLSRRVSLNVAAGMKILLASMF